MRRCPAKVVPPVVWQICRDIQLIEFGILPAAGGWLDQAETWCHAISVLAERRAYYQKELSRE